MKKLIVLLSLLAACAFAQQPATPPAAQPEKPVASKPAAPPTAEEKFAIATLQRDIVVAQTRMKAASDAYEKAPAEYKKAEAENIQKSKELAERMAAAQKSCKADELYDGGTFACVPKPPEK